MTQDSPNPYQSPAAPTPTIQPSSEAHQRLLKVLKDFRSQIIALGALFIILGAIAAAAGVFILQSGKEGPQIVGGFVVAIALAWFLLGACICAKQIWALYSALVLCYLSVIGNVVNFNLCSLIILAIVILQSHRVLGWAKQLRQAGIPLTTRPEELNLPVSL
jgi:hypothetical protein